MISINDRTEDIGYGFTAFTHVGEGNFVKLIIPRTSATDQDRQEVVDIYHARHLCDRAIAVGFFGYDRSAFYPINQNMTLQDDCGRVYRIGCAVDVPATSSEVAESPFERRPPTSSEVGGIPYWLTVEGTSCHDPTVPSSRSWYDNGQIAKEETMEAECLGDGITWVKHVRRWDMQGTLRLHFTQDKDGGHIREWDEYGNLVG